MQSELRSIVSFDPANRELTILDHVRLNEYAESLRMINECADDVRVLIRRVMGLNDYVKNPHRDPEQQIDWGFFAKVKMKN